MVMEFFKRIEIVDLILSTVNVTCGLIAITVLVILWFVRKTKVVYSTALMTVMFSTHYTLNKKTKFDREKRFTF